MEITTTNPSEGLHLVRLTGKFTIEDINTFKEKTRALVNAGVTTILMNFGKVDYIDSSGIGSLILLMNTAKNQNIKLIIYDLQDEILNVLKISHLERFFSISTSGELGIGYPGIDL